jgi:ribose transport system substrate-binding protein
MHKFWTRSRGAGLLAVGAVVLVVAGCGSSSSSSSSTQTSSTSSSQSGSSGVAQAKALVAQYASAPTSIGVTAPLTHKPAPGKVVYYVACCGPSAQFMIAEGKAAASALGWTFKAINTTGTPESLQAGWNQAASDPKVAAVLGNGVPAALISSSLAKLQAKHAVAITWANVDQPSGALLAVLANGPFISKVGDMLAAWMVATSNGHANSAIFTVPSLPILPPLTTQFTKEMHSLCSSCTSAVVPEPITAVGTDMPARIVGYLQAHPSVNYITEGWDDMFIGAPAAIAAAGLASKVTAVGYAPGSTANTTYIKNGQVEKAVIPYPYGEVVWKAFDILARHFNGQSIAPSVNAPLPLTFETASTISNPGKLITIVPNFQSQYKKLWGVG